MLTRLRLKQAPVFTGNVHLITKFSLMSIYSQAVVDNLSVFVFDTDIKSAYPAAI